MEKIQVPICEKHFILSILKNAFYNGKNPQKQACPSAG
jgi:hypothetical protein